VTERLAGLYLHVPFCARVCPYCDFAVRTGDVARRRRYADHLVSEIDLWAGYPQRFDTIYFGGGTPSLLPPDELARIVGAALERLSFPERPWIFLEANPDDVTPEAVAAWRQIGVDTLSLGVQTLDPDGLRFLGREHAPEDTRRAVELALAGGFHTVSIDLIYGLPGQTPAMWRHDLDRALELGAHHLSCYQLTIHAGTRFGLLARRGELTELPNEAQAELFRLTHRYLNDAGLVGYEVSQFAAGPEHFSRHNTKYWDHTPYLGLGPSAHSFDRDRRWWNLRRTDPWQEHIDRGERPVEDEETLGPRELALEALMTGFRTYAGVDLARLRTRFGVDLLATNATVVERLVGEGRLTLQDGRLVPTLEGLAVADSLAVMFEA
jgi:putative oxygen-independent coproporphyrinogen III oxidase